MIANFSFSRLSIILNVFFGGGYSFLLRATRLVLGGQLCEMSGKAARVCVQMCVGGREEGKGGRRERERERERGEQI